MNGSLSRLKKQMAKCLVTGHKGYIGSHLFSELNRLGHTVHGIDLKEGNDILDCLPNEEYDYVFHMAAMPKVGFSVENPSYTLKHNVLATSRVLEWSKSHNVKRVIFSSSAAVNGNNDGIPTSPYGLHKLMSEMECKLYSDLYGLDTVCLRYYNVYSEDQKYGGSYSTAICAWMEMIRKGIAPRIDGDGEQTRDMVHVKDIVSANIFCMNYTKEFCGDFYDIGSGKSVSLNQIKNFIDKFNSVVWSHAPARVGDIKYTKADVSKIGVLGWKATVPIEEGLKKCFCFYGDTND
jgi:UDP-glucose 4-epimerase